jgi:LPXTG-site transpeptidase (sortase) family protein
MNRGLLVAAAFVASLAVAGCNPPNSQISRNATVPPLSLGGSALRHRYLSDTLLEGAGAFLVKIPTLGVAATVVQGTSTSALQAGAGHYPNTPLPGTPGNVAVFGHRTYYGRPFAHLDRLRAGDEVSITTPVGVDTYRVVPAFGGHRNPWIVTAPDYSVVSNTNVLARGHWLTLVTDDPRDGGQDWLVVRLTQVG